MITDSKEQLNNSLASVLIVSVVVLLFHCYFFAFYFFKVIGFDFQIVNFFLIKINNKTGFFANSLYSKIAIFFMLALYSYATRGVKNENIEVRPIILTAIIGFVLFFFNFALIDFRPLLVGSIFYMLTSTAGFLLLLRAGVRASRLLNTDLMKDVFNEENESFEQEETLMDTEFSVNLSTTYKYKKKIRQGWINIINPFRATLVLGTPGSGKSFSVVNPFIKQMMNKGFVLYVYDYKFPDLTKYVWQCYQKLTNPPAFYIINFDDPTRSHRCNPFQPKLMKEVGDAYELSVALMLTINKSWVSKRGEFFVESPIVLLAAIIWFLKSYKTQELDEKGNEPLFNDKGEPIYRISNWKIQKDENGKYKRDLKGNLKYEPSEESAIFETNKYCTLPHAIEFIMQNDLMVVFNILDSYEDIENFIKPFKAAIVNEALEQLSGQVESLRIPLALVSSPNVYWVMTGDDFTLDVNNPDNPKILCIGNNPQKETYSGLIAIYNYQILKLAYERKGIKFGIIIDEFPTIFIKGIDRLINTARSYLVATVLACQDISQLERDYNKEQAKVISNTIGNIVAGQVFGETAKNLEERFGKIMQKKQSITISKEDTSTSFSTEMASMIPASKISNLSQGAFVGAVVDNNGQVIEQKTFNGKIEVSEEQIKEAKNTPDIPAFNIFADENGVENIAEQQKENYRKVKSDIKQIIKIELLRIEKMGEVKI